MDKYKEFLENSEEAKKIQSESEAQFNDYLNMQDLSDQEKMMVTIGIFKLADILHSIVCVHKKANMHELSQLAISVCESFSALESLVPDEIKGDNTICI